MKRLFRHEPRAPRRWKRKEEVPYPYDYKTFAIPGGGSATITGELTPDLQEAIISMATQAMKRDQYEADQL